MNDLVGKTIFHYKIISVVGQGGMGIVYKAEDTKLKRHVALKFLPPELTRDEDAVKRFIQEAQTTSALDHQNICTIYEIDETVEGQMFIGMAYYEGETLKEKIKGGPLEINEAIDIATQIAQGLKKAHDKGIVHRDIKPGNIIITKDGVVKILDFGLAKLSMYSKITKTGSTLGTVSYMSPEQVQGLRTDHCTDIWSLGIVMYEMLTGQLPFTGEVDQAVMYGIVNHEPTAISDFNLDIPLELEQVVNKALSKNPSKRFKHIEDMVIYLLHIKSSIISSEKMLTYFSRILVKNKVKIRSIIIGGILGVFILIIVSYVFYWHNFQEKHSVSDRSLTEELNRLRNMPKIAVLYFDNLVNDSTQSFFAEGMTEDIITELSNIQQLRVISPNEVLPYKGKEVGIKKIGRELRVDYILGGSIRRSNNQLRVIVHLTKVEDGFIKWNNRFDRELHYIFKIQEEIAISVANKLEIELSLKEKQIIEKRPTKNMTAYDFYLKGRQFLNERSKQDNLQAEQMFRQAISLDENFALGYVYLARIYLQRIDWGYDRDPKWNEEAKLLLEKVFSIDSTINLSPTYGYYYWVLGEAEKSVVEYRNALESQPNDPYRHYALGTALIQAGDFEEAELELQISLELMPDHPDTYRMLAMCSRWRGKPDEAIRRIEKAVKLAPNLAHIHYWAGLQHFWSGSFSKAESYYKNALKLKPENPMYIFYLGKVELYQRKLTDAINHLETAANVFGSSLSLGAAYRLVGDQLKTEENYRDVLRNVAKSNNIRKRYISILSQCLLGQISDPTPLLNELSEIPYKKSPTPATHRLYLIAKIYNAIDDQDSAIDAIQEMIKLNMISPKYIVADPFFEDLHNNPRFIKLANQP